jgi:predicted ATPase
MKNFKSWKDSGEVELAPLRGFLETNSSGKSSLLQKRPKVQRSKLCQARPLGEQLREE